jgi:hypothetical protein
MGRFFGARTIKNTVLFAGLLTVCLVSGCYERVTQGNQSIYRFAWWIGPSVIAGGILGVPVGWFLRNWNKRWGFVLMCLAPVLLVIVAPAMYSDRVIVDDQHFDAKYGFWFSPNQQSIRFENLREIRYVKIAGNRGRTNYELHCLSPAGQVTVVPAGDLVRQTVPEIAQRAKARGVAFVNEAQ